MTSLTTSIYSNIRPFNITASQNTCLQLKEIKLYWCRHCNEALASLGVGNTYAVIAQSSSVSSSTPSPLMHCFSCSISTTHISPNFGFRHSISQSIKTHDAWASLGYPDRCLHRRLSPPTRSIDDIDWPGPSIP